MPNHSTRLRLPLTPSSPQVASGRAKPQTSTTGADLQIRRVPQPHLRTRALDPGRLHSPSWPNHRRLERRGSRRDRALAGLPTVMRARLPSFDLPSGNHVDAYFVTMPSDNGPVMSLRCEWARLPLSRSDLRYYLRHIGPAIIGRAKERLGIDGPGLWLVV
jgi:hypothetical protein